MTQVGENAPLAITRKALRRLEEVKIDQNVTSGKRLRVKSRPNEKLGILGFDMYFDKNSDEDDMVYNVHGMELIMDMATATYLVGSTLDLGTDGEFMFKHMDMTEYLDLTDIQYN